METATFQASGDNFCCFRLRAILHRWKIQLKREACIIYIQRHVQYVKTYKTLVDFHGSCGSVFYVQCQTFGFCQDVGIAATLMTFTYFHDKLQPMEVQRNFAAICEATHSEKARHRMASFGLWYLSWASSSSISVDARQMSYKVWRCSPNDLGFSLVPVI